jgi:hypothetical protein
VLRTGAIALVVGALLAWRIGGLSRWPLTTVLVLWFSLGGHWIELWFLNWLRPRLAAARSLQIGARIAVWFIGGVGLGLGMALTAMSAGYSPALRPGWWLMGLGFVALELLVHLLLHLRGRPSFYTGLA